jgi:hypothetical protein
VSERFDMILGKQRARARLRDFIGSHILSRKNARVLCLPGENGREIEHVYRKLGFRDENIVGVEMNPKAADGVRSHYPKIRLEVGDVREVTSRLLLVEPNEPPFDVVSLDYCGQFSEKRVDILRMLQAFNKIADRVVVATNFFAGREKKKAKEELRGYQYLDSIKRMNVVEHTRFVSRMINGEVDYTNNADPAAEIDVAAARDVSPFRAIVRNVRIDGPVARFVLTRDSTHKYTGLRLPTTMIRDAVVLATTFWPTNETVQVTPNEFASHIASILLTVFIDKIGRAHHPDDCARYGYVNDAGHRMISDYLFFKSFSDKIKLFPDVLIAGKDPQWRLAVQPNDSLSALELISMVQATMKLRDKYIPPPLQIPPRIDLGGGAFKIDDEKLRSKIIQSIKKGRSDEEILAKFPITIGSLRAFKANVTRERS